MALKYRRIIYIISAVFVTFIMTGSAELLGENEIIFPEISAIAVGMFFAPERSWKVSIPRLIIFIGICATLGVLIVRLIPLPKYFQMIIGFLLCQLIFVFSKTSFAPMISATVLPILLGTESIIYPVSAILLTVFISLVVIILEKTGLKEKKSFSPIPYPDKKKFIDIGLRLIVASAVIIPAILFDFRFIVAPPLLVAFTEFSNPLSGGRKNPLKAILVVSISALIGTLSRYFINVEMNLPVTLSAVVTTILVAILMYSMKMFIPPAGALAILPSIVPVNDLMLYPLEIFSGVTVFMIISILLFRQKKSPTV